MRIEFIGEPWETSDHCGMAVGAVADGRPLVCVFSRDALDIAARSVRRGVTRSAAFRQYAREFREALAAKLPTQPPAPAAVITAADLRPMAS